MPHRSSLMPVFTSLLFGLTSCADEPATPGSRLIGTWEAVVDLTSTMTKVLEASGSNETLEEVTKRLDDQLAKSAEQSPRVTYAQNGSFILDGSVLGRPVHEEKRWAVIDDRGDRITIEIEDKRPEHNGEKSKVTYVFEKPDLIRQEDGSMRGEKFRRIK